MLMPRFSHLSDEIFPELDEIHRYKLVNQVTFPAIVRLIDRYLPNNLKVRTENQLALSKIDENQPLALAILSHITDNLAYALII